MNPQPLIDSPVKTLQLRPPFLYHDLRFLLYSGDSFGCFACYSGRDADVANEREDQIGYARYQRRWEYGAQ
jgi:hypothetical protein